MNAEDPQGSPPDRGGGSSSTPPPSDRGGGGSSTPPGAGSQPEIIEVGDCKAVLVITPALVYMKGDMYALPADIVQAVDDFTVPAGYRGEGSRERSFMSSLGVSVFPLEEEDDTHKHFCLADPTCRRNKATVPCKKGDRSNVNTHHKTKNIYLLYICALYVGYIQNHTRGIYPGITLQKIYIYKFCMAFVPVPGCTPAATIPGVLGIFIPARNFGEFYSPVPQYPELV